MGIIQSSVNNALTTILGAGILSKTNAGKGLIESYRNKLKNKKLPSSVGKDALNTNKDIIDQIDKNKKYRPVEMNDIGTFAEEAEELPVDIKGFAGAVNRSKSLATQENNIKAIEENLKNQEVSLAGKKLGKVKDLNPNLMKQIMEQYKED